MDMITTNYVGPFILRRALLSGPAGSGQEYRVHHAPTCFSLGGQSLACLLAARNAMAFYDLVCISMFCRLDVSAFSILGSTRTTIPPYVQTLVKSKE